MATILETEAQALEWCRRLRQSSAKEFAQMMLEIAEIDYSRLPIALQEEFDDAVFFAMTATERRPGRTGLGMGQVEIA